MPIKVTNNAYSTLSGSITNVATSLSVAAGTGSRFPTLTANDYFYASIVSATDPNTFEIVKVTARAGDTFTIVRAQDGTAAAAWDAGAKVELRVSASTIKELSELDSSERFLRAIPPAGQKTSAYTLAKADLGLYVKLGTGGSVVVPTGVFDSGDVVSIYNATDVAATITCNALTSYQAGTTGAKTSLTLAARGLATVLFDSSTVCVIAGNVS